MNELFSCQSKYDINLKPPFPDVADTKINIEPSAELSKDAINISPSSSLESEMISCIDYPAEKSSYEALHNSFSELRIKYKLLLKDMEFQSIKVNKIRIFQFNLNQIINCIFLRTLLKRMMASF